MRIHAFLTATDFTLYLDTSGDALFKRGYRTVTGDAPLRENLAAGILRLSGWQPEQALLDPMCGSGTFLTEAAMVACNIAPGANRSFGFEKLKRFDADAWKTLRERAHARINKSIKLDIYGSDRFGDVLQLARTNLAALGLEDKVTLKQANVLEMPPPPAAGILVTNPPCGVRWTSSSRWPRSLSQARRRAEAEVQRLDRLHPHRRHAPAQTDPPDRI